MKKLIISLLLTVSYTTTAFAVPQESIEKYKQTAIEHLISIALNENGYLEKQNGNFLYSPTANAGIANYTKYAYDLGTNFYGCSKQGLAWCDVFIDWCFVQAFGMINAKEITYQNPYGSAGCSVSMSFYQTAGQFYQTPQPGDQIFFQLNGTIAHTGLVYKVDGNTVYTIEGNTNSASEVIINGEGVNTKQYDLSLSRIAGYGRPNFERIAIIQDELLRQKQKIRQVIIHKNVFFSNSTETNTNFFQQSKILKKRKYFYIDKNHSNNNNFTKEGNNLW